MRTMIRSALILAAALAVAQSIHAPTAHAQASGANIPNLSVRQQSVRGDLTREGWDGLVSRGIIKMTGHRVMAWSTGNSRWEYSDGSHPPVWSAVSSAAGVTLDSANTAGQTITLTSAEGPVTIANQTTSGSAAFAITSSGVIAGSTDQSGLTVTQSAANTTSGTVRLADFQFTGSVGGGTAEGLRVGMTSASHNALHITTGGILVDSGGFVLTSGSGTLTSGDLTLTDGKITHTDAVAEAAYVLTSAATTHNVWSATANAVTTGNLLYLESSATGFDQAGGGRVISVSDGAAEVFDVGIDGATHIKGTAAATALLIDAGNAVLTSGNLTLTSGAATLTSGNLTMSAGLLSVTPASTSTKGVVIVGGSGARSVSALEYTSSGSFSQPQVVLTGSGAFSGNFTQQTVSGAASGNFEDTDVGAVAYTGDVYNVGVGSTCTACQALVISGGAASRTTELVSISDAGTNAASVGLGITTTATNASGVGLKITGGASFAGIAESIDVSAAAVGAQGLLLANGTRAFTSSLVTVSAGSADASGAYSTWTVGTNGASTTTNHVFDVNVGNVDWKGNVLDVSLGASAVASKAVNIVSVAGARTADIVDIDDNGTSTGDSVYIAKAASSGHILNLTYDGAGTGNVLLAAMGSNVTGGGVVVTSAATTGLPLSVTHTGAFASAGAVQNVAYLRSSGSWDADTTNASYVLNVQQDTGAGAVGDYAVRISATGTSVEGLRVDDGKSLFDEAITVGVSGTGVGSNTIGLQLYASPGAQGIAIDATTSGNRPTHTDGVVDVNVTTATASTRSVSVSTTTTGDQDAVVGIESVFASGGLTTASKRNSAFKASYTGTATDAGYYASFWSASAASFGTTAAFMATGTHSRTVATLDSDLTLQPVTTSSGAGEPIELYGGDANTSGAGGDAEVFAGSGAGAGNGGNLHLRSGAGAADGYISLGIANGTDDMTISDTASAAGFDGVNTVAMAGAVRPTRVLPIPVLTMHPITGAAAATYEGGPARTFVDATANQAAFYVPIASNIDATADIVVTVIWTAAAGAGGPVAWRLNYKSVADNGDMQTAFTNTSVTNDTLTGNDDQERVTLTIPHAAFADSDLLLVRLERLPADASDTLGQDVSLLGVTLAYRSLTP